MRHKILIFMVLFCATEAQAHNYIARLDEAVWQLDPSPLSCRLWQAVPNYGEAVFEVDAGKPLKFYVNAYRPVVNAGEAELMITAPEWREDLAPKAIGRAPWHKGRRPIELPEILASELLAELQVGMTPAISHPGWFDKHPVTVGVSAVSFQTAFRDYMSCVSGLYPAGFDELRQSFLHFETNKYGIKGALKKRLDLIAGYVAIDSSVRKISVDGHTDSDGRRGHNWELSRLRALAVKEYLEQQGVPADTVVMNYYGEGHPVRKNNSKANKAVNRRVLVRLER